MQSREIDVWQLVNNYCTQIETNVKNFKCIIQQQHQQLQHQALQDPGDNDLSVTDLSGRLTCFSPNITKGVDTLLFSTETKQVFLRTALSRKLFQRLKVITKYWLANVPEDQRKQATRLANNIAKAVVELRISSITEQDLATYKAHIQQSCGRECNIPMEQIRLAFSQKIRVFLQNTKADHKVWAEKYEGKINTSATTILFPDSEIKAEEDTKVGLVSADFSSFPSVEETEPIRIDPTFGKRPLDALGPESEEDLPEPKRRKEENEAAVLRFPFGSGPIFPHTLETEPEPEKE